MRRTSLVIAGCIVFFALLAALSIPFLLTQVGTVQAEKMPAAVSNAAELVARNERPAVTTFPKPQVLTTVNLPLGIGYMPSVVTANPDSGYVYVGGQGDISVLSGTQVIKMIETYNWVTDIGVNTVTGLAYAAIDSHSDAGRSVKVISGTQLIATLPTASPSAIGVNPKTGYAYVANYGSKSVTIISGTTTVTTVTVGTQPAAIGVNPHTGYVYVANYGSDNVTVLSGTQAITTFASTEFEPRAVAVNPVTDYVYIGDANSVMVISETHVITTLQAPALKSIQVNPATGLIYVGSENNWPVTIISGTNIVGSLSAGIGPQSIGINPITGYVYVASNYNSNVTVVSETQVITTFPVGWGPSAVGVNPATGYVYVSNENDSTVTVISGTAVIDAIPTAPHPFALDLNPVTRYIYVANQDNHTISVISDTDIITAIPAGAFDVAANPATGYVYASTGLAVTVISSTQIVTALGVGNARYIAINPNTGYVYTVLGSSDGISIISGTSVVTTAHVVKNVDKVVVNPATGLTYVTCFGSGVAVLSGTEVVTTISLPSNTTLVAVNPTTGLVYGTHYSGSVSILSGTQLITTLPPTGDQVHALGVNPATGYVYLSQFNYGTLVANISIISGTQRVATLTLGTRPETSMGIQPKGIGVDYANGYVYVSDPIDDVIIVMKDTSIIGQLPLGSSIGPMSVDPVTGYVYTALWGQSIAILNTVLIDLPYQAYLPIVRRSGP